jgi:type IV pilus assembly protein PilF
MTLRLACLFSTLLLLAACSSSPSGQPRHDARTHYLLGSSALAENNPTVALQEFLQAEKADRRDPDIQAGLARAYMQKRAYDLAEAHLQKALTLTGGAPQHYNDLGALYLSMERYDDAITAFRKAADNLLFADSERAWAGIGFAYFQKQDYAAAERAYRKALEQNPRYAQAMFRLGELYYNQDRSVEALESFSRATVMDTRFVDAHYWLGLTALKVRDNSRARQAFAETIRLAPDSEQARLARGYLKTLP